MKKPTELERLLREQGFANAQQTQVNNQDDTKQQTQTDEMQRLAGRPNP